MESSHSLRRALLPLFAALALMLLLIGCSSQSANNADGQGQSQATQEKTGTLKDNVTIEDVSIRDVELFEPGSTNSVSEPNVVRLIEAAITNDNDVSCCVYPSFAVDLETTDNYGKHVEKRYALLDQDSWGDFPSGESPFWSEPMSKPDFGKRYLGNAAIPAHSTQKVWWKMGTQGWPLAELDSREDATVLKTTEDDTVKGIDVLGCEVLQTENPVIEPSACDATVTLTDIDDYAKSYVVASVTNTTDVQWKSAVVKYLIEHDGMLFDLYYGSSLTVEYVDIGATKTNDLSNHPTSLAIDGPLSTYKATPLNVCYTPDPESTVSSDGDSAAKSTYIMEGYTTDAFYGNGGSEKAIVPALAVDYPSGWSIVQSETEQGKVWIMSTSGLIVRISTYASAIGTANWYTGVDIIGETGYPNVSVGYVEDGAYGNHYALIQTDNPDCGRVGLGDAFVSGNICAGDDSEGYKAVAQFNQAEVDAAISILESIRLA